VGYHSANPFNKRLGITMLTPVCLSILGIDMVLLLTIVLLLNLVHIVIGLLIVLLEVD
jgi:hypothetical protein